MIRWVYQFGLFLTAIGLVGCGSIVGTTIGAANYMDQHVSNEKIERTIALYLDWINKIKNEGDPTGDYLLVKARQSKWIDGKELSNDQLLQFYLNAANKGSIDARIFYNLLQFNMAGLDQSKPIDSNAIKKGEAIRSDALKELTLLYDKQCWYYEVMLSAKSQTCSLVPTSVASHLWHSFRDGGKYFSKDEDMAEFWKNKHEHCKSSTMYKNAKKSCMNIFK